MISTIIIDDERLARTELINALAAFPKVKIIGECANADDALNLIDEKRPELIFLDIQMPGKDGFQLLQELTHVPYVIFATAYDEHAMKAFDVNALDYLLKPIEEGRLKTAVEKAVQVIGNRGKGNKDSILSDEDRVFVKDGEKCWFVQLKEVRLLESEGNYVRVYFDRFKPLILKSLNNLESRLDGKTFFRANRKHIINLKWIQDIEPWFNGGLMVTMKDEKQIEISRRQAVRFKDIMSL